MSAPVAFLSHASEDKERFARDFALRLRQKGIDVWFDQFEVNAGDNLVEKIYEALDRTQAVIVVLSNYSVHKPWVREELNTSVVNRIQKKCKIIPVVLDACDVPASLRATKWITIKDPTAYEAELNEVVEAIFGHYERPPVGAPPAHIQTPVQPLPSLTKTDTLVLKVVGEHVLEKGDYTISPEGIRRSAQALEIGPESLRESLEILQEEDYLRLGLVNSSGDNLHHLSMTPRGLEQCCEAFVEGYEPMVRQIGYHLLNQDDKDSRTIADALKRPHLIVRNVLHVFDEQGLVQTHELPGGGAYVDQVSPRLKRWLAE